MILEQFKYTWDTSTFPIKFTVCQNPAHIIHEKYYLVGKIPPISERANYLRLLGTPEHKIKSMIKNHIQNQKNSEKNQKIIDDIFAKFNVKPTKKKVLKSVKKN